MDLEMIKSMSHPDTIKAVLKLYPRSVYVLALACAIVMMGAVVIIEMALGGGWGVLLALGFIFYRLYLTAFARMQEGIHARTPSVPVGGPKKQASDKGPIFEAD